MHPPSDAKRYQRIRRGQDGWYFRTREGVSLGPFSDYLEATTAADDLIQRLARYPWHSRKIVSELARERSVHDDPPSPLRAHRHPGFDSALIAARRTKAALHEFRRRMVLQRAIREYRNRLPGPISDNLLHRLRFGWGNEGWSASEDFLRACIDEALRCPGPILECGTGLTTLVVGVIAERRGIPFLSLEHSPEWCKRTRSVAASLRIGGICVEYAPLREYGEYCWYEFERRIDRSFALVVCDGPPGQTQGGRYGLMPVAQSSLDAQCVTLLDDAIRPEEQAIARRWHEEFDLELDMLGHTTPYFRLTRRPPAS